MAPEQVRGEEADPRTDIFAFGSVLYEMLAGHPPFSGGTADEVMSAVLDADPARIVDPPAPVVAADQECASEAGEDRRTVHRKRARSAVHQRE